jgi:hypothetical protein
LENLQERKFAIATAAARFEKIDQSGYKPTQNV